MDPVIAVWIGLALNAAGVLMMIGAKRQQISDLLTRMKDNEDCIDRLEREKLAVSDYRREHSGVHKRIGEAESRAERDFTIVSDRCSRIEQRLDGQHGGRR